MHHYVTSKWLLSILSFFMSLSQSFAQTGDSVRVENASFEEWSDGLPSGWKVEIGAANGGNTPLSKVAKIGGPAILLSGDSKTKAWQIVSQNVQVQPGKRYRLEFSARSKGIKREGAQFDNCYVGWFSTDKKSSDLRPMFRDLSPETKDWETIELEYSVPKTAKETKISIFLSKTGLLGVKDFKIIEIEPTLIANGDFRSWTNGKPAGWSLEIGAQNGGNKPISTVEPIKGGGIEMSGKANTVAWQSVSQELDVKPGKTYTARFSALAKNVQRQGGQFDNCYVGVFDFDSNGKPINSKVEDLSLLNAWKEMQVQFSPAENSAKTSLMIFLSKSGSLQIKNVVVEEATTEKPFR